MEKPVHEKADPPPGKVDETVPASLSVDVKALLSHPEYIERALRRALGLLPGRGGRHLYFTGYDHRGTERSYCL